MVDLIGCSIVTWCGYFHGADNCFLPVVPAIVRYACQLLNVRVYAIATDNKFRINSRVSLLLEVNLAKLRLDFNGLDFIFNEMHLVCELLRFQ